jgi:hypothetical protein
VKVAAGYVGTVTGLRWLINCNMLDSTIKGKIPFRHINRHKYMDEISRKKVVS